MSDIIVTEHLAYTYPGMDDMPGVAVFEDMNLTVEEGSFVAILGTNGCGKSTLAKHFNSILLPCGGKVWVSGMDTSDENKLIAIRRNVGMVFQNPDNQIVATIVEDDVAFGPENLGISSPEIRRRVDNALKQVGMYEYREHAPHLLSGGQKQRVAIAGMLAMNLECLVLDEPTAMLDPRGRKEVMDVVKELNKKGMTVICITHYMDESVDADRGIVMSNGHIVKDGTPKQIFKSALELKSYGLELPKCTYIANKLIENGLPIQKDILTYSELEKELCKLFQKI